MLASCLEYCRRNIQSKTISRLFLSKPNSLLTNTGLAFWWHVHLHSVCLLLINCLFTSNFSVIVDLFKEKLLPKFDNFGQFWWVEGGVMFSMLLMLLNEDDDNENVKKKQNGLLNKNTNLHVTPRLSCTFFCRHCTTTTWKCLIPFHGGRKQATNNFSFA